MKYLLRYRLREEDGTQGDVFTANLNDINDVKVSDCGAMLFLDADGNGCGFADGIWESFMVEKIDEEPAPAA